MDELEPARSPRIAYMTDNKRAPEPDEMRKRTITLEDGRYMIFYEFGDEALKKDDGRQVEEEIQRSAENV